MVTPPPVPRADQPLPPLPPEPAQARPRGWRAWAERQLRLPLVLLLPLVPACSLSTFVWSLRAMAGTYCPGNGPCPPVDTIETLAMISLIVVPALFVSTILVPRRPTTIEVRRVLGLMSVLAALSTFAAGL